MIKRNKETAYSDFITMIQESWTWDRLTKKERELFLNEAAFWQARCALGTWAQRYETLQGLYSMFLYGLGYNHGKFREPARNEVPLF